MTPLSPSVSSNSGSLSPAQALPPSTLHPDSHLSVSGSHSSGLVVPKSQLGSNQIIHENKESSSQSVVKSEVHLADEKSTSSSITPNSPELNRGH